MGPLLSSLIKIDTTINKGNNIINPIKDILISNVFFKNKYKYLLLINKKSEFLIILCSINSADNLFLHTVKKVKNCKKEVVVFI